MLPRKPGKKTETGLSKETDAFLNKILNKSNMSQRKKAEIKESIKYDGTLPQPKKPKVYKASLKPRPEQKVFTMARVGKKPLQKPMDAILEETNYYQPERAPYVPVGQSSDEKREELYRRMAGIKEQIIEDQDYDYVEPTLADQILREIEDRHAYLEELHQMGVFDNDAEVLRQIQNRFNELHAMRK